MLATSSFGKGTKVIIKASFTCKTPINKKSRSEAALRYGFLNAYKEFSGKGSFKQTLLLRVNQNRRLQAG
jgi:hypothetical protein